ncbi:NTF2-related export protein 2-like [Dasypus novemcinctus]|uniref:NTF2-related export protein 2-like n=1 Tax=Dasypus novemcinctus TaxID=9361 RepID=UPI00062AB427|nr:NTF2-related export protein 2-like [Dasypus novemcinctus]
MDGNRDQISLLYIEEATLMWNGKPILGQKALNEFFTSLPASSFHVSAVDCQPVRHPEMNDQVQIRVLVVVCGTVKFEGKPQRNFHQTFILKQLPSSENTKWKIAHGCFRFQDWGQ